MHYNDKDKRKEKAIEAITKLAEEIGKTPTIVEYKRSNRHPTYDMVVSVFGSWRQAIDACGLKQNPFQSPPSNKRSRGELITEFVRVANEIGELPSIPVFNHRSSYSKMPFVREFGSWQKAKEIIASEYADSLNFEANYKDYFAEPVSTPREKLGLDIPLIHCPENETETIVLFSMVAERLGYEIVSAQIAFPDLIVKENGLELRFEAEWKSSTFYEHGHPLEKDVVCLCWRKDKDIPEIRNVISLEDLWIKGSLTRR